MPFLLLNRPGLRQTLALAALMGLAPLQGRAADAPPTVAAPAAPAAAASAPAALKTLRYAFRVAETGFDPAKISDLYSRIITSHLFEAMFFYDHLARPARIKPLTAVALPEVSADFKHFTIRIRPGIFFADDQAFKGQVPGKGRELEAQD